MSKTEIHEYIREIRDSLWQIKDHSDGEDFINFKLDVLMEMIEELK